MISENFDQSFVTLQWGLPFCFEFEYSKKLHKTKAVKNICKQLG